MHLCLDSTSVPVSFIFHLFFLNNSQTSQRAVLSKHQHPCYFEKDTCNSHAAGSMREFREEEPLQLQDVPQDILLRIR